MKKKLKKYKTLVGVSHAGKTYKKLTTKQKYDRLDDYEKLQYKIKQHNAKIRRLMKKKLKK